MFAGVRKIDLNKQDSENLQYIECDVTDDESIQNTTQVINQRTETLSILVNNAGVNKRTATGGSPELVSSLKYLDRQLMLEMFNVNAVAPLMVTKSLLPHLSKLPSFVINISSCRASYGDEFADSNPNYGYSASKCALNMLTNRSVFDLPENVATFAVHPGSVKSQMNETGTDDPTTQAQKILQITDNWKSEFNGKFLRFDGSLYPM